jgi:hypothetical protein
MPSCFATCAIWLLRIVLVAQSTVQAAITVFDPIRVDSPAFGLMLRGFDVDEIEAANLDRGAHLAALAMALAVFCVPLLLIVLRRRDRVGSDRWPWTAWQLPLLAALVCWNAMLLVGESLAAGDQVATAVVAAAALPRVAVPLALCILMLRGKHWSPRDPAVRGAIEVLRVAAVAAFASLAWQAVHFDPALLDAVLGTAHNFVHLQLNEAVAQYLVCGGGIVSAALAFCMLFFRWQGTAVAMAAIASLWLLAELSEGGLAAMHYVYPSAALRIATVAAPLAILLLQLSRTATLRVAQDEESSDELVIVNTEDA